MGGLEAIDRGWLAYAFGMVMAALTALQLWSGQSIRTGLEPVSCAEEPLSYWLNIAVTGFLSLFAMGMGIVQIGFSLALAAGVAAAIGGMVWLMRSPLRRTREALAERRKPRRFVPAAAPDEAESIAVRGWSKPELDRILGDFLSAYRLKTAPNVTPKPSGVHLITFPRGVAADHMAFLVNYLQYPKHFDFRDRSIAVAGHTVLSADWRLPERGLAGRRRPAPAPFHHRFVAA